ncbi:hypothetical protein LIA77_03115 [Sarocladium implicatum]|nr:hypothetical protein LIA77_03115 [Sarocladium implicatum]
MTTRLDVEEGYKAYVKLGKERLQLLKDGTLAKRIAACMARSNRPLALALRTGNDGADWPKIGEMLSSPISLRRELSRPQSWTSTLERGRGVGHVEDARLLYQVPVECHRAGVVLHSFALAKLSNSSSMPDMCGHELRTSLSQLRQFRVETRERYGFRREEGTVSGQYGRPVPESIDQLYSAAVAGPFLTDIGMEILTLRLDGYQARTWEEFNDRYPLCHTMPITIPWKSCLKKLRLNGVAVGHGALVHLFEEGVGSCTKSLVLYNVRVHHASWTVIWNILRHSLEDAPDCEVWLDALSSASPEIPLASPVMMKAVTFVKGIIDENPGATAQGSEV